MNDPNRHILERAAEVLSPLLDELVFVGGCATGLLVTDATAAGIRPTRDVDTITQVSSDAEYAELSARLRKIGLREDNTEGVICRWFHEDLIIDVMPDDERILGFTNRWYKPAISTATLEDTITVIDGRQEIVAEVRQAEPTVKSYLANEFSALLAHQLFLDALPGFLLPDLASQARAELILARLESVSRLPH